MVIVLASIILVFLPFAFLGILVFFWLCFQLLVASFMAFGRGPLEVEGRLVSLRWRSQQHFS